MKVKRSSPTVTAMAVIIFILSWIIFFIDSSFLFVFVLFYENGLEVITEKNIKNIRIKSNITQEDLCARMQVLGYQISRSDISKLETGKRYISDYEVAGFAKVLKISILDLYQ